MYIYKIHNACIFLALTNIAIMSVSQAPQPLVQISHIPSGESTAPIAAIHSTTHMVTVEVMVKDHKGRPVRGLKAEDFEVNERSAPYSTKLQGETVAAFREISTADLVRQAAPNPDKPFAEGIYSNAVFAQQTPIPPTIILIDRLNSKVADHGRIHEMAQDILKSLPRDTPVAIFELDDYLRILQDFTTDPVLLKSALDNANSVDHVFHNDKPAGSTAKITLMDVIMSQHYFHKRQISTTEALPVLADHVIGYPGRKNLLWLTPNVTIDVLESDVVTKALEQARIAVYPINTSGVQGQTILYDSSRNSHFASQYPTIALRIETMRRGDIAADMQAIADETGGQVCQNDNDLGDCVRKAVADSSNYYEISYYPILEKWTGEYRHIVIKSRIPGLQLAYRQGYYATPEGSGTTQDREAALKRAACEEPLDTTAILFTARSLPADAPENLKYQIATNPGMLTLAATAEGGSEAHLRVAACTFDPAGNPQEYMTDEVDRKFTAEETRTVAAEGLKHDLLVPGPRPAAVRLAVMDLSSDRVGTLRIPVSLNGEGFADSNISK